MMRYSLPAVELTFKNIKKFELVDNKNVKKIKFKKKIFFLKIFFLNFHQIMNIFLKILMQK